MTTIMSIGNSEGTRRCDARCHDATSQECDCICGGRYHGKGTDRALDEMNDDMRAGVWGELIQQVAREGDEFFSAPPPQGALV